MAKTNEKRNAIELRQKGHSLSYISEKVGVSRASLSHWLRDLEYIPNDFTIQSIKKAHIKGAVTKSHRRVESITALKKNIAREVLGEVSERDMLMMAVGLFAGRVSKNVYERIELMTSDGKLGRLFVKCLELGLLVPREHIFARLRLSPSNDALQCIEFWSKTIGVPKEQVKVGYTDRRSSRRGTPFGSVRVYLKNSPLHKGQIKNGKNSLGVLLFRKIEAMVDLVATK